MIFTNKNLRFEKISLYKEIRLFNDNGDLAV